MESGQIPEESCDSLDSDSSEDEFYLEPHVKHEQSLYRMKIFSQQSDGGEHKRALVGGFRQRYNS